MTRQDIKFFKQQCVRFMDHGNATNIVAIALNDFMNLGPKIVPRFRYPCTPRTFGVFPHARFLNNAYELPVVLGGLA